MDLKIGIKRTMVLFIVIGVFLISYMALAQASGSYSSEAHISEESFLEAYKKTSNANSVICQYREKGTDVWLSLDNAAFSEIIRNIIFKNKKYEFRCFNQPDNPGPPESESEIDVKIIEPKDFEVAKGEIFNFTINISCSKSDCGEIMSYLDPEASEVKKDVPLEDSRYGYILEFEEKPIFTVSHEESERIQSLRERLESRDLGNYKSLQEIRNEINKLKEEKLTKVKKQSYIVKQRHQEFKRALKRIEGKSRIINEYFNVYNGVVVLNISKEGIEQLLDLPYVKGAVSNKEYQLDLDYTIDWLNVSKVWELKTNRTTLTGKGVIIANIDSGVQISHAMFGNNRNDVWKKCSDFQNCPKVLDSWDFIDDDSEPWDNNGHGTHTASTSAGIDDGVLKGGMAPDANLYIYKVCDSFGRCRESDIIAAIERATDPNNDGNYDDRADIISMSLGGRGNPDCPSCKAIDNAADLGVISIVSAGNSGPNKGTIGCPACAEKAIAVAAACKPTQIGSDSKCKGPIAEFSSRGPLIYNGIDYKKPEIIAPGVSICAAKSSNYLGNGNTCLDDKHVRISGTSMSAPHVAGIGALIVQANPGIKWDGFEKLIQETAASLGDYSYDEQGAGLINPDKLFKDLSSRLTINYLKINPEKIGMGSSAECVASVSSNNGEVDYVEFSVEDVSGDKVIDKEKGNSGDNNVWLSSRFIARSAGEWKCHATAYDTQGGKISASIIFVPGEKGLISTAKDAKPFYTLDNNPSSCNLKKDESCIVNWRVVPTGNVNTTWKFFAYINSSELDEAKYTQKIDITIMEKTNGNNKNENDTLIEKEEQINNTNKVSNSIRSIKERLLEKQYKLKKLSLLLTDLYQKDFLFFA